MLAPRTDSSWLLPAAPAPAEIAGTLTIAPTGECVFHDAAGCGVYASRPASCAHFPYVCLIDQRGVHVTLSHYCPTAAALLFEDHGQIAIVEGPSPAAGFDLPEGLDARESLPPAFAAATTYRSAARPHATKLRLMSSEEVSAGALYPGDGPSAVSRAADRAMAVLQVEAARQCSSDEGMLDATRLKAAIRQTDLITGASRDYLTATGSKRKITYEIGPSS